MLKHYIAKYNQLIKAGWSISQVKEDLEKVESLSSIERQLIINSLKKLKK